MSASQWQNRIIGYKQVPANQLLANPANPRVHGAKQREAMRGGLDNLGWLSPVIVNKRTGFTIDGHLRIEEALSKNEDMLLPVLEVDLSPEEESLALASFDWITSLADYDHDLLAELIGGIETEDSRLQAMLDDMAQEYNIDSLDPESPLDAEPQIDRAEELNKTWQVQLGDLFEIIGKHGTHRLLCGDSASQDSVKLLMGDDKADLLLTDPPYGVSYSEKNRFLNTISPSNRIQKPIENDAHSPDEMSKIWLSAFKAALVVADEKSSYYIFSPQGGELMMMMMMIQESGWQLKHSLIWVKNNHVLGRVDYAYKHEPILYGWNKTHNFYGGFQTSILEFDKPNKSDLHPTMKPIELLNQLIANSSKESDIVLDLFGGSGSTMVACEQLSRICYMMELDPSYCAVILQRMQDIGCSIQKVSTQD